ncbi:MAG: TolC family protein [Desulfuromusa sp.]|jgi:outer membrane protein|nr:TolC family protein [Desulfuromusa sp.]
MKKEIAAAFLFLLCFLPLVAQASKQIPQSIRDLIALGLESNLGLQIEMINISQGSEATEIEKAVFDSELFAATGYDRSSTPFESSFSPSTTSDSEQFSAQVGISKKLVTGLTTSLSLSSAWVSDNDYTNNLDPHYSTALLIDLNQPLLRDLGGSINTTSLEISRNRQRQASLTYLLQAQNLVLQLEAAARQIARESEITRLRQESLELANTLYMDNQKRFDAGVIPVSEVQEAETEQADRQLSLSLAIQSRDILFEELNRQLNHTLKDDFKLETIVDYSLSAEEVKYPDLTQLFASARLKRIELKIHDYSVKNSSLQQNYLRNQLKPQLDLKFQAGVNGLSGDERHAAASSRYSGSWLNSFGSMGEADGYQWSAGLQFSMPLGNRSAKSRYRQSELQLKQDHYRQQDLEAAIRSDLVQQQLNVSHALEQLKIAEHFSALAKITLNQEQRRLEEGLSNTFRMISFQSKMIEAKIGRVNALTRYHLALAQMEFARGNILERHGIILTNNNEELSLENR